MHPPLRREYLSEVGQAKRIGVRAIQVDNTAPPNVVMNRYHRFFCPGWRLYFLNFLSSTSPISENRSLFSLLFLLCCGDASPLQKINRDVPLLKRRDLDNGPTFIGVLVIKELVRLAFYYLIVISV